LDGCSCTAPSCRLFASAYAYAAVYTLRAFPTRRSSDLGQNETTVVSPAQPALVTAASGPVTLPGDGSTVTLTDTATLSGAYFPTGSITFTLTYNGAPVAAATQTDTVTHNGTYHASTTLPTPCTVPATSC